MNFRSIFLLFLLSLFFIKADGAGSITGRITDSKAGAGLPGVNIMIKGTYYGTASDLDGRYRLIDIPPGSYDLEVSIIGYKIILRTGVLIRSDSTVVIDFKMEETV